MKKVINEIMFGKNSLVSGAVALAVVLMIGLGCFCNKDKYDFNSTSNTSNTSNASTPTTSPSVAPTKNYTKADASKAEIPSNDEMQDIVKKTLLDFNDALQKEDFGSFHSTISKVWQKQITPQDLQEKFQLFIDGDADMSAIRSMTADFTTAPEITRSTGVKTLEAKGEYDTSPNKTTFELKYIAEGKEWKLIGLNVITNVKRKY